MSQQTVFWFPSMKVSDIIRALEEWGLHVSEEQIQRPTDEVVQAIYAMFLQQITGLSVTELENPARKAVTVLEQETDLFTDSLTLNLFLHHVRRIANAARVHDFCMADLTQPEPERTRNILSAIVNFVKFAEERGLFLKKLRDQFTTASEERQRLAVDVRELREKAALLKNQRALEEPRCRAIREENAVISKQLISIKTEQAAVIEETESLKQEKRDLSRQKEALAREEEILTNAINTLRSRIVQSPDRIKKHIAEMGIMAQEERTKVAASENKARDLKMKLDALNSYEQELKKIIDDLRMVHSEHLQLEDTQHKLMTFRAELERKHIFKQQSYGRAERARRQMKNAEEKLEKTRINVTDKKSHSEDELRRLKRSYEEMSEERRENDRHVEEKKQAALDISRKKLEHLKQSENELNEFLAEYWGLRHQTEVYMETMANKLGIDFST